MKALKSLDWQELTLQDGKSFRITELMEQLYSNWHIIWCYPKSIKRLWYIISSYSGLQNGSPDGIALVDASNKVIQFLSYEGAFKATNGPAIGMTSTDIGIAQTSTETVGNSLQLIGRGTKYSDFTWTATVSTFVTLTKDKIWRFSFHK
jgi:hypothetical protein